MQLLSTENDTFFIYLRWHFLLGMKIIQLLSTEDGACSCYLHDKMADTPDDDAAAT